MNNKEAVKQLFRLLCKFRKSIAIIISCLFVSAGLNFCIPLISKCIMDDGFLAANKKILIELVIISMFMYVINSLIDVVKEKKRIDISAKIHFFLSEQAFTHLMKLQICYFNNTNYAETINNINMDISQITSIADGNVFFAITQIFSMIGGFIGLFVIDLRMTILVLLFVPIKYFVMKYFVKQQKKIMDEFIKRNQDYAKWFGDTIGGIREVKIFNIFQKKYEEFLFNQNGIIEKQKQMNMLGKLNIIIDTLMVQFLSTVLYIFGANLAFDFQLSVGSIFAFITYNSYVTGSVSTILSIGYLLAGIIPSTKRFYMFMDLEEESDNGKLEEIILEDFKLEHVFFSYKKKDYILQDINILFPKGSKTALIGKNGAGKTTIINLLTRICEPTKGKIMIGERNINEFPLYDFRNIISIVSQQIYLFNDTIRKNICLYKEISENEIILACQDSGLEEFIKKVSLDYIVGENGNMLSGGQKQKIALARALIHNKPIIIFDEATSNSDVYSEYQINSLLYSRLKNKTIIVITHKKYILKEMDQIVILEEGKVVDMGSYQEIISRKIDIDIILDS